MGGELVEVVAGFDFLGGCVILGSGWRIWAFSEQGAWGRALVELDELVVGPVVRGTAGWWLAVQSAVV